jgi:tetratricopeptide (TPR) repeat protein
MNFDKAKAMRSAERYVAQGKIRAAIGEYRTVVENDPRDIATLNMLGDLYAKNAEKRDAVQCYLQVADHYSTQGFAQKAIAIYNKISRIQPESIEVSAKLAELHRSKGSLSEARSHYETLANHYQKNGKRLEALSMFKQIALLDPNNTEVCMSLADSYLRENQRDEAVEAYAEAGARFARQSRHEEAIRALMKGFDINSTDLRILEGLVKAQTALGRATKAVSLLEEILENEPFNRDVLYLLIDCCLDSQNAAGAEAAVIKLVEVEPANYPKFLDLIRIYLNSNDPDSAARILNMSAEYLLAGGQSDECGKWINEILERNHDQLTALRLLVRYNSWLNDENGIRLALERVYLSASKAEAIEEERFALLQLVKIRPHETRYRDRLNEINEKYGFTDEPEDEPHPVEEQHAETPDHPTVDLDAFHSNGRVPTDILEAQIVERMGDEAEPSAAAGPPVDHGLSHGDEIRVQKEIDSINFYIDNEYIDLAVKALAELVQEFGERDEFMALRQRMNGPKAAQPEPAPAEVQAEVSGNSIGIDEIRSEFGLDDTDNGSSDYETHFHTAVAYQEMGLMEQAIAEFQDAINCTNATDGTRRFFHCANLLGHCFLQNGTPNHAITWLTRALETPNISDEEHHGLWYELALAYASSGDADTAAKYFEQIYAENVDFRDVAERVKNLVGSH